MGVNESVEKVPYEKEKEETLQLRRGGSPVNPTTILKGNLREEHSPKQFFPGESGLKDFTRSRAPS